MRQNYSEDGLNSISEVFTTNGSRRDGLLFVYSTLAKVALLMIVAAIIFAVGIVVLSPGGDIGGKFLDQVGGAGGGFVGSVLNFNLPSPDLPGIGGGGDDGNNGDNSGGSNNDGDGGGSITDQLKDTWEILIGEGEITEEMKECGGTCGEEAQVTEVCSNAIGNTLTADEISISAAMQNNGQAGNFMIRLRPVEGVAHALVPCSTVMCSGLNWNSVEADAQWQAEYESSSGLSTGKVDTRNLGHFASGFVVQVYREPSGGASSFTALELDDRLDAVPIAPEQIPETGDDEICIDLGDRGTTSDDPNSPSGVQ